MASYFDEHDCEPLREGEQPDHLLQLARLLIHSGVAVELEMEFENMFPGERKAPPASKSFIESLPREETTASDVLHGHKCPVCLGEFQEGQTTVKLPCSHRFHSTCILPWLERTNTCPVCRHELPTDDADYEEYKKQKMRAKQREHDLDTLHDSMYG